jgi:hypothetical protein
MAAVQVLINAVTVHVDFSVSGNATNRDLVESAERESRLEAGSA